MLSVCVRAPARDDALKTGQALLQKKFMVCVRGCGKQDATFDEGRDTLESLFRLLEDDPHSALNAGKTAACSPIEGRSRPGTVAVLLSAALWPLSSSSSSSSFFWLWCRGGRRSSAYTPACVCC